MACAANGDAGYVHTAEEMTWLFSREEVEDTPSRRHGISKEKERKILASCVWYLGELGDELQVPQLARSVAIKLFQRFFMVESMYSHPPVAVATACLFIACKVQECVKRLRDVVTKSIKVKTRSVPDNPEGNDVIEDSDVYRQEKKLVLAKERDVLRVLNFEFNIDQPYKYIFTLVKQYSDDPIEQRELTQTSWNFLNDSLRTYLHVQFTEKEIATAALHLAATYNHLSLKSGDNPDTPWYAHFNVDPLRIVEISHRILDLYDS
mmetsp:Transcript_8573/g.25771  ORF Transcript_8573/g.25771 Transcript_8573/m.25771 type:complete len:264 (-) Transcript_8573:823-1614(-)